MKTILVACLLLTGVALAINQDELVVICKTKRTIVIDEERYTPSDTIWTADGKTIVGYAFYLWECQINPKTLGYDLRAEFKKLAADVLSDVKCRSGAIEDSLNAKGQKRIRRVEAKQVNPVIPK